MKKIFFGLALLFIFAPGLALAAEKIDNFSARVQINKDATISVVETIVYNFGDAQKHGIFREIPTVYNTDSGKRKLKFYKISVTDGAGNSRLFEVSYPNGKINIKIGHPDKLVTGQQAYVINYTVKGALDYFDDHDELYWNITGNDWPVPVTAVGAVFTLPRPMAADEVSSDCYAGLAGSKQTCANKQFFNQNGNNVDGVIFGDFNLSAGAGLTAAVGFPKGLVAAPSRADKVLGFIFDYWPFVLPIIAFAVMFYLWWTRGRDPEGRGTIIPEYDVPNNLTPIELGVVYDNTPTSRDVSAEIIYLATLGYLKINRLETEKLFGFKNVDYELEKLKETDPGLAEYDKKLLTALFGGDKTVKISSLKNKFYKDYGEIIKNIWEIVVAKEYYKKSPAAVKAKYAIAGAALLFVALFASGILKMFNNFLSVAIFMAGIVIIGFGIFMPARTKKGALAKEQILGLKMYLSVAEKDRLAFHNAPEKNPALFDKFLPYAIALGVESAWAGQFADIYNQPPNWYNGGTSRNFTVAALAGDLGNFNSSGVGDIVMAPSRSSGSGLRGGGFSGGGFGGGGGGSW